MVSELWGAPVSLRVELIKDRVVADSQKPAAIAEHEVRICRPVRRV